MASGIKFYSKGVEKGIGFEERDTNTGINERRTMLPTSRQGNKLNNEKKNGSANCAESHLNGSVNKKSTNEQDDLDAKLAKKVANFKIGVWKGAEHEGSVNNAQAKVPSELTGPKANNLVEGQSVGKA